jgi:cytochrome P450 family 2 subfamily U polypeptide 1
MVINMHSVHKDEKVWGDPHTFRPERFLDESGNLTNLVHFMPFGMGIKIMI